MKQVYAVFCVNGDPEGNASFDLLGLTSNIDTANKIVSKDLAELDAKSIDIEPCHPSMGRDNNFTIVSSRTDIEYNMASWFGGYIIELMDVQE